MNLFSYDMYFLMTSFNIYVMKFIRRQDILINESLKKAKEDIRNTLGEKWLEDSELATNLNTIAERLKKNPNLIYNFYLYHKDEDIPMGDLQSDSDFDLEELFPDYDLTTINGMIDYIQNNKQQIKQYLPKDLIKYDTFEELTDDITKMKREVKIKKFVNKLKGELRRNFDFNDEELKTYIIELIDNKDESELNDFIKRSSSYATIDDLKRGLSKIVKGGEDVSEYERYVRTLLNEKYPKGHEVIYDKNGILIITLYNKEGIKELGGDWCIVNNQETYYDSYCNPLNGWTQYLVFDFNKIKSDPKSLFGVSIDTVGDTKHGAHQDRNNNSVSMDEIMNSIGLNMDWEVVFRPIYADMDLDFNNVKIETEEELEQLLKKYDDSLKDAIIDKINMDIFYEDYLDTSKSYSELVDRLVELKNKGYIPSSNLNLILSLSSVILENNVIQGEINGEYIRGYKWLGSEDEILNSISKLEDNGLVNRLYTYEPIFYKIYEYYEKGEIESVIRFVERFSEKPNIAGISMISFIFKLIDKLFDDIASVKKYKNDFYESLFFKMFELGVNDTKEILSNLGYNTIVAMIEIIFEYEWESINDAYNFVIEIPNINDKMSDDVIALKLNTKLIEYLSSKDMDDVLDTIKNLDKDPLEDFSVTSSLKTFKNKLFNAVVTKKMKQLEKTAMTPDLMKKLLDVKKTL